MPIISTIGRKSWKVRFLTGGIYAALSVGAISMVYPFLLMVAGSTKCAVDAAETRLVPSFLTDDAALYRKYVRAFFNDHIELMNAIYDTQVGSFQKVEPPGEVNAALVAEWKGFLAGAELPHYTYACGFIMPGASAGVVPHLLREFKHGLSREFGGDMFALNRAMGTDFPGWNALYVLPGNFLPNANKPGTGPLYDAFHKFKASRPFEERYYFSVDGYFRTSYLKMQYSWDIGRFNDANDTDYASWDEVRLERVFPADSRHTDREREKWTTLMRTLANVFWLRADGRAEPLYREFLRAKHKTIEELNRRYGSAHASFDEIPLIQEPLCHGMELADWQAFVKGWADPDTGKAYVLPESMMKVHSVDFMFRDHLQRKYETIEALNTALRTSYKDWIRIIPPQREFHYLAFTEKKDWYKREFSRRNFISVLDYVLLHGRAMGNTVIYCLLAVVSALTINPLAAYALSRYRPPAAYKALLFLMLTMAFPPMVTQIPNFLLLRDLGMLNTYWGLILPGLANGYSIFLLKGFFDSLPQELYESAQIDGAGELRVFWQITMSLSKPILAVIGLGAFTAAYSNFMMALLICQDERMWTLMPWLYQLQMNSCQGIIFASLIIAAIPTFLVFVFCQNIIMRGIVVPVEK